ncbi:helix-turn-helix domain-containing protein [Brevibacillus agri]|uniref:MarR family transcriptional regulator n=1 Tax=Brevibacillus TaxID=55080 RepID=UPI001D0ABD53|nr:MULTISPECIES: helix-turn-helix domain-containing protein [Brevibacillus]MCC0566238.1 MarR family transcriptional regulator [Brevibacillus borstelensis]MCG5252436.1 MarR family transcriptional regulator [Brevibacillus agri]MED1646563.1 helix-turn-helix domain-containing protein [Brevibacillus agri]MED1655177.1 helix-turn-helix domain-containing protein [Brevibacillus agri]MED1690214.1 helix-turn-helix domain-containing protein [Brevibacillus agri]
MKTLKDKIIDILNDREGLTDREITDLLLGQGMPQQSVNQACRTLEAKGVIKRINRNDGLLGNYIVSDTLITESNMSQKPESLEKDTSVFAEDNLKEILKIHLQSNGWEMQIAWGKTPGIDINAYRDTERWIIEVKGLGSSNPMNINYFLGVLAETLQRMDDPNAKYSIALPDVKQFRNLWGKLPLLAKKRTGITAVFIDENGVIEEVS